LVELQVREISITENLNSDMKYRNSYILDKGVWNLIAEVKIDIIPVVHYECVLRAHLFNSSSLDSWFIH
jgi:hypothetical protein